MLRLENALKKIDAFLSHTPEGCLKWQNKNGKTYYYHQFMKDAKWVRRYIKKGETSLARALAQNQISMREKEKQWREETYEKNMMYPENLRYETEQGDVVRSKSEVKLSIRILQF